MNRRVTDRAVLISHHGLVMERRRIRSELISDAAVTFETQLSNTVSFQHLRIRRSMRGVTRGTAFDFQRCVLEYKGSHLIAVTLNTSSVRAYREFALLLFKPSVGIVAVAAIHRAFEHFVPKRA